MEKLRIGGAWSGLLEVRLDEWTVAMLREELARRSDCRPDCINLISAGRVLKDGDGTEKLINLGVKDNAKILATKVSVDLDGKPFKEKYMAEEERFKRLSRLKATADSLVTRHVDGAVPIEDFNLELENQSGEKVSLGSPTDQRAVMMGLMLHKNAKALIRKQKYRDALEILAMGEEAFSLCDQKVLEMVDNVSILQLDTVWCYFMLRDIARLSDAGIRLSKARQGIEHSHGKESSRLRIIQGGRYPEIALHLRMELLEGVIAYHSGQLQKSREALACAQEKYLQLQIPDEALSLLLSMGYKEHRAKRALRICNLDVGSAIDFLIEEKLTNARKREENLQRQKEILEQKRYGMTPLKKALDIEKLNYLTSMGFERDLAAEALRRNENDTQKALDDLTNPTINSSLQIYLISKKRKRIRQATSSVQNPVPAESVVGSEEQALGHQSGGNDNEVMKLAEKIELGGIDAGPSTPSIERDEEMEHELTEELQNADSYSDYDMDVQKEGEAIAEYLALLTAVYSSKP